ncbi:BnaC03g22630D [Brassica napus]|uniref:BnaC03g22630D protein n=1 Tax=Brassica napus TaxID=3708 RepID=A0A078GHX8_BRANA|nr:BnaC03g22630D [Brassica napus]
MYSYLYMYSDFSRRPSLSCDGLVCMPVPGWIMNPSTGEFLRFPSGRDPKMTDIIGDVSRSLKCFLDTGGWDSVGT